ncbi:MAG: metabolite traffic protein EboE [Bacteroidia bacterium]
MQLNNSHLSYCTNIHPGEHWLEHFSALRQHFPSIKKEVSPEQPMGIGLRLSNAASLELSEENNLASFQEWMRTEDAYVFTMNGFPYGNFHHTRVKENVHQPDWTTAERVAYTLRLFRLLEKLAPEGMDGGVSTSPLGYRRSYKNPDESGQAISKATRNILSVTEQLVRIKKETGKLLHLDIEPEPDGLLESGEEFIAWYESCLVPLGIQVLKERFNVKEGEAENMLKEHVRLCYDICHFSIGYENHGEVIRKLNERGIKIGKIQVSAALKAEMPVFTWERKNICRAFSILNESTYLHQVVARKSDNSLIRYRDLPDALADSGHPEVREWRSHFHVPVFLQSFSCLQSTQSEIIELIEMHNSAPLTAHFEVETYTWEVLPESLRSPMTESIVRELQWVKGRFNQFQQRAM